MDENGSQSFYRTVLVSSTDSRLKFAVTAANLSTLSMSGLSCELSSSKQHLLQIALLVRHCRPELHPSVHHQSPAIEATASDAAKYAEVARLIEFVD